jgi:hypothetical protein
MEIVIAIGIAAALLWWMGRRWFGVTPVHVATARGIKQVNVLSPERQASIRRSIAREVQAIIGNMLGKDAWEALSLLGRVQKDKRVVHILAGVVVQRAIYPGGDDQIEAEGAIPPLERFLRNLPQEFQVESWAPTIKEVLDAAILQGQMRQLE